MTARNSLKRLIRARMRKTGESYSSARRYFHTEGNKMNNLTTELQPSLWPDWVVEHPWLVSFLAQAEAETRNRGDTCCNHFHIELTFLRLGPPVSDWLEILGLDARMLREDTVELLGSNSRTVPGAAGLAEMLTRGERARDARNSGNPKDEFPLQSVDEVYTGELLELAKAEALFHGDSVDERHFLIALAMLLFEGSPPTLSALRYLTGISQSKDTSYGVRIDDHKDWVRALAESHGADPTKFPYDIHGLRD